MSIWGKGLFSMDGPEDPSLCENSGNMGSQVRQLWKTVLGNEYKEWEGHNLAEFQETNIGGGGEC